MFLTELKFASKTLINWFNKKINVKHLELDLFYKNEYEKLHPIDLNNGKCCICNFPLDVDPKVPSLLANEMS